MHSRLTPELFTCFRENNCKNNYKNDMLSGVIVGIVAIPLAIAFAIASGVKPEQGLYTAIIAGFIISFFGGSRVQIGGPTGAFIVVVYNIIHQFGYEGLAIATMMAGAILILMGLLKMGAAIKYIPYPMTIGFTTGIAVIIVSTQLKALLGITVPEQGDGFISNISLAVKYIHTISLDTIILSAISLLIILLLPKVTKKIPGSIVAIILCTLFASLFNMDVATIGSQFGEIPNKLPVPQIPQLDMALVPKLIPHALTIAILAAIESLLSAVVADGMTGHRHKSNMELIAQGIANLVSPIFMGIPATGAIARTATNVKNGGKTPIAGITHAIVLLLVLLIFGNLATMIPMASLAAVLLVVAYHMSEWRIFVRLFNSPIYDIFVMLITFILTVLVDLTVAIEVGIVSSSLLFMYRMANLTEVINIRDEINDNFTSHSSDEDAIYRKNIPDGVEVFEIHGPFFFGAANQFKDTLTIVDNPPKVLILRMRHIFSIDATAMRALEDILNSAAKQKTKVIISGIDKTNLEQIKKLGLDTRIGIENICTDIDRSLKRAEEIIA